MPDNIEKLLLEWWPLISGAIVLFGISVAFGTVQIIKWRERKRFRARMIRGQVGERITKDRLTDMGFEILASHPHRSFTYHVDREEEKVDVFADYLVRYGDRTYVVEVKTGDMASPTNRGTRRQLLEYSLVYEEADALLLANGDTGELWEIGFPNLRTCSPVSPLVRGSWKWVFILLLGVLVGFFIRMILTALTGGV